MWQLLRAKLIGFVTSWSGIVALLTSSTYVSAVYKQGMDNTSDTGWTTPHGLSWPLCLVAVVTLTVQVAYPNITIG